MCFWQGYIKAVDKIYTFDGNSVKINIGAGLSTVKVDEYKSECSYRLLKNSINNSDSKRQHIQLLSQWTYHMVG